MKGLVFFAGMVAGVVAGVVDVGVFRRDAIEAECGIGHFGGVFQSIPPASLPHFLPLCVRISLTCVK